MNQHFKYLGKRPFCSTVIVRAHTHNEPITPHGHNSGRWKEITRWPVNRLFRFKLPAGPHNVSAMRSAASLSFYRYCIRPHCCTEPTNRPWWVNGQNTATSYTRLWTAEWRTWSDF